MGSMIIKNNKVIYQRQNSAFSHCIIENFEFDHIFEKKYEWVHLTGITPILSNTVFQTWDHIINTSLANNIPVSIDFNHRLSLCSFKTLWSIIKPYLPKLELFVLSLNDLYTICNEENIYTSENCTLSSKLLEMCKHFKIKRAIICVKDKIDGYQTRYSIMCLNGILHKSPLKNMFLLNTSVVAMLLLDQL